MRIVLVCLVCAGGGRKVGGASRYVAPPEISRKTMVMARVVEIVKRASRGFLCFRWVSGLRTSLMGCCIQKQCDINAFWVPS